MGRIKPAALLLQSKRKKAPARISATTIVACGAVILLFLISIGYVHKYRAQTKDLLSSTVETDDDTYIEPVQGDGTSLYAVLNTTHGAITLQLFDKVAPKIVEDFVKNSVEGVYDGGQFHRAIKGFLIQGGALENNATAKDLFSDGDSADELRSGTKLEPFTLTMENVGPGQKHDSQFFITTVGTSYLNKKHTVFGRVIRGRKVVQDIENQQTDSSDRPLTNIVIHNVIMKENL